MLSRIKKGDMVVVIAGKDRGNRGRVIRVLREQDRVVVEGINRVKRHTKPNPRNQQGGILEFEAPIHISNVMLLDTQLDRPVRVRSQADKDKEGGKIRVSTKSGSVIG